MVWGYREPMLCTSRYITPQLSRRGISCRAYTVFSPSKVNLFLRVIRRREDGYHDLASLFHIIDFGDTLVFEEREGGVDELTCNVEDVPTDGSNLVIKALDLFRRQTGAKHATHAQKGCACPVSTES
jgi:4-diphosphocytidyl-2C-methyl-D-erythritol kinase